VLVYRAWVGTTVPVSPTSNVRAGSGAAGAAPAEAPDVRLEALQAQRPAPGQSTRNPFRFGTRQAPEQPLDPGQAPRPAPGITGAPPAAAGTGPIPLKFIGVVAASGGGDPIAVLSDPRGVYHGREGDVIEGRYRILRIGTESIELANVDGSGRQTIRLSGS
jgi:hypothetical protein